MIEESLLGPPPLRPEGLACPRGRLTSPPAPSSRPASASSRASAARSLHTPSPIPAELLPAPRGQLQGRQGAAGQVEGRLGNGGSGLVEGELVYGRSRDEAGRWQEEISHGFERLVALASRVDMRSALDSPHWSQSSCNPKC